MYCEKCGDSLPKNTKFCSRCGQKVIDHKEKEELHWEEEEESKKKSRIKCVNCKYIGEGLSGRSMWASILALLCILFIPLITIIYFLVTPKWLCPKCKSKFVEEIDEQGKVIKKRNILLIIVIVIVGIAFFGILSSIVLVSLGGAREKARDAVRQANIQQIVIALELHYAENNHRYVTSSSGTPIPFIVKSALSSYLDVPDDPLGPDYGYTWVGNLSGCGYGNEGQCFCIYAVLEGESDYPIFAANEKGTAFLDEAPTSPLCFELLE